MMNRGLASAAAILVLLGCRTVAPVSPPSASQTPPQPPAVAPTPAAPQPTASQPPDASQPPAPEHYENVLRWTTASEVENFGYDVYRASSADGPFERLTKDPIPGAGTIDVPQHYSYADGTIDPHQTYYYYVECISFSGERKRFTPVIAAKPKLPPDVPAPQP